MVLNIFSCAFLTICMFSSEKCLFRSSALFFFWIGLFFVFTLSSMNCLSVLEINPLGHTETYISFLKVLFKKNSSAQNVNMIFFLLILLWRTITMSVLSYYSQEFSSNIVITFIFTTLISKRNKNLKFLGLLSISSVSPRKDLFIDWMLEAGNLVRKSQIDNRW